VAGVGSGVSGAGGAGGASGECAVSLRNVMGAGWLSGSWASVRSSWGAFALPHPPLPGATRGGEAGGAGGLSVELEPLLSARDGAMAGPSSCFGACSGQASSRGGRRDLGSRV